MTQPTVRAIALTTGYRTRKGAVCVTEQVSESLWPGELVVLLGPNGSGKSTLLRTLSGFQAPLSGDIEIGGRPLAALTQRELARSLSVVLTERPPLDNMTAQALVGMGRAPYTGFWGSLSRRDREAVDRAMQQTGVTALAGRDVRSLSDGERQKVMIAKALAQETAIICLDEPTAFLDYPSKVEVMQLLRRLGREEGKSIFMSTHDLEVALQTADRAWLLDRRLGLAVGTPAALAADGSISRYFGHEGLRFDAATLSFRVT